MAVNINDLIITELDTIRGFEIAGENKGMLLFQLDELQSASISQSEETTDITGKGGRRLNTIKRNKSVTVSGNNGIVSGGLLAVQTGSNYSPNATQRTVLAAETVTVSAAHTATITGTPAGDSISATVLNADGTMGASYINGTGSDTPTAPATSTVDSDGNVTVTAGKFTYASKVLTFDSGVAEGSKVIVYYTKAVTNAGFLADISDKYSKKAALYVDATAEDKCGEVYHVQFYFPKVDFNGNFTLDLGDTQVVHSFEATVLSGGGCDTSAIDTLFTYTVYGD